MRNRRVSILVRTNTPTDSTLPVPKTP
jgi:hypothetical protein